MIHPTFIVDETPDQVNYTPQQNEQLTQHQPEDNSLVQGIVIAIIAALIIGSL